MKEIKFRAWDGVNMKYGCAVSENGKYFSHQWGEIDYELMQYTGLKDKNGKEIYEGDIIRNENGMWSSDDPQPGVRKIIWVGDEPKFVHAYTDGNPAVSGTVFCKGNEKYFEVIGNIYENPDLINSETTTGQPRTKGYE